MFQQYVVTHWLFDLFHFVNLHMRTFLEVEVISRSELSQLCEL